MLKAHLEPVRAYVSRFHMLDEVHVSVLGVCRMMKQVLYYEMRHCVVGGSGNEIVWHSKQEQKKKVARKSPVD
jgi:hypothetical protein